jgi:hypothetical protein
LLFNWCHPARKTKQNVEKVTTSLLKKIKNEILTIPGKNIKMHLNLWIMNP